MINDSLGHSFGDRVLEAVARRLESAVRETDSVARLGGDEFAVLCEEIQDQRSVVQIAERIVERIAVPYDLDSHGTFTTTSIGVALSTGDTNWEDLLRDADVAMYRAKDQGGNRYELFGGSLRDSWTARLDIEEGLWHALDRNELELDYQPEVDLTTGRVTGVEALLRWRRPGHGVIAPMEFIPIAEETGLILTIGSWALEQACRQSAEWRSMGPGRERLSINVNVSARQLAQSSFPDLVEEIVKSSGIDPQTVCLEITETVFMGESDSNSRVLDGLRRIGVRIAIDDFGAGYASLGYLKRFPVDVIKIDRSFVQEVAHDARDSGIVSAVVDIADAFGITATAEGIETEEQLSRLRALGCHAGQGYLFARPQPAQNIEDLLDRTLLVNGAPVQGLHAGLRIGS